jgi:hypothetical protein
MRSNLSFPLRTSGLARWLPARRLANSPVASETGPMANRDAWATAHGAHCVGGRLLSVESLIEWLASLPALA